MARWVVRAFKDPMADLLQSKYPRLAGYLSQLPRGLDSHPGCLAKGTVFRSLLETKPLPAVPAKGEIPDGLHALLVNPPMRSTWLPEATNAALNYLIGDVHDLAEPEHLKVAEQAALRLYNGPIYKLMMNIVSPQTLLSVASARWGAMHQGTKLSAEKLGASGMRLVLDFPEGLFTGFGLRLWGGVFRVTLEHSRAKGAKVVMTEALRTRGVFECSWQ